jgi:hypothetical protein
MTPLSAILMLSVKESHMKTHHLVNASLICGALLFGASMTACDRAVEEHTKTTETPNGTKVEKTTVVEHNDGTISKEKESKTVTNP